MIRDVASGVAAFLRRTGRDLSAGLVFGLLFVMVMAVSWWLTVFVIGAHPYRLRAHVVTTRTVRAGEQLDIRDVKFRLTYVGRNDWDLVPTPQAAKTLYVVAAIGEGWDVRYSKLAPAPSLDVAPGHAVVSVVVSAGNARALRPGMMLAFAKENAVVPASPGVAGYRLLAGLPATKDKVVLFIDVPAPQLKEATGITGDGWTSFVTAPAPPVSLPAPAHPPKGHGALLDALSAWFRRM